MDIQSVKKEYHLVRVVDDKGDVYTYKRFGHQKWIKLKKVIINWKS
jgi:hypothetical protein